MISYPSMSSLSFPLKASAHIHNGHSLTILIGSRVPKQKAGKLVAEWIFT